MKLINLIFVLSTFFMFACSPKNPEPISFGKESCHHCKMTISDHRFGGELVNPKGKVFKFDSLECLKEFKEKHSEDYKEFVVDASNNGELIEAEKAFFTLNNDLRSPMGGKGILASAEAAHLNALLSSKGNLENKNASVKEIEILRWNSIYKMLKR